MTKHLSIKAWFRTRRKLVAAIIAGALVIAAPVAGFTIWNTARPINHQELINAAAVDWSKEQGLNRITATVTTSAGQKITLAIHVAPAAHAYQFGVKAEVEMGFMTVNLAGEAIYDRHNSELYVKMKDPTYIVQALSSAGYIDPMAAETVASTLKSKWLKLTIDDIAVNDDIKKVATCATTFLNNRLLPQDEKPLLDILNKHNYVRLDKTLPDDMVQKRAVRHYEVTMQTSKETDTYGEIGTLESYKTTTAACADMPDLLSALETPADAPVPATASTTELWIDKQTGRVTKILQTESSVDAKATMTQEMLYDTGYTVVIPITNVVTVNDLRNIIETATDESFYYDYSDYYDPSYYQ